LKLVFRHFGRRKCGLNGGDDMNLSDILMWKCINVIYIGEVFWVKFGSLGSI
jgi:hypothetical protein